MSRTYKITQLEETARDRYDFLLPEDSSLIPSSKKTRFFKSSENRVETVFFTLDGRILDILQDNTNYSVLGGGQKDATEIRKITLFPEEDAINRGFESGDIELVYNFYNNLFSDSRSIPEFFIQEISPDRTEIVALAVDLPTGTISRKVAEYKSQEFESDTFQELLLRFQDSTVVSITNIDTITVNGQVGIKLKLYSPLPPNRQQKSIFSVEEPLSDGVIFKVEEEVDITDVEEVTVPLKGPNFSIKVTDQEVQTSELLSLSDILANEDDSLQGKLLRRIRENSISLGIDYTKPDEFIHFSSYFERLNIFLYKKELLEELEFKKDNLTGLQKKRTQEKIDDIQKNFDHFEEYLFDKEIDVNEDLLGQAQLYDNGNQDRLVYSIPDFIGEDPRNRSYLMFVDMIGHVYDNLWIYLKAVEKRYNTDNRLDIGLSKDLLIDALKSFGVSLKSNKESVESLFKYFSGVRDIPEFIGEIQVEVEDITVETELEGTLPLPKQQYIQEVYKRIFHNIPLILKSKGTERGLRTLINCFGIPSNLLEIKVRNRTGEVSNLSSVSSLDRINVPSGSYLESTLSSFVSIENLQKLQETENFIEIGFSTADLLNKTISSGSLQNIDNILGDPRNKYKKEYTELKAQAKEVLGFDQTINIKSFSRVLEFYNNSLFRNLLDFVDATAQTSTSLIVKSHALERNKHPETLLSSPASEKNNPEEQTVANSDIEYLFDIIFNGTIEVGETEGGDGGAFSVIDKPGIVDKYQTGFIETITLPKGGFAPKYTIQGSEEPREYPRYNGEFKGSNLPATTGELNKENVFKKFIILN